MKFKNVIHPGDHKKDEKISHILKEDMCGTYN